MYNCRSTMSSTSASYSQNTMPRAATMRLISHVAQPILLLATSPKSNTAGRTQCSSKHTLQALLNSNPSGAFTVSVCPRKNPVSLRSRSITTFADSKSLAHLIPYIHPETMAQMQQIPSSHHFERRSVSLETGICSDVLCLSQASSECLALFPPFCMCLTFERVAPVKPNIYINL